MSKEKLPKLTEAQVRALANAQSFERGKSYYQGGAIVEPVQQGRQLRAECEGSGDEPYQISVTLGAKGIEETSCTCPYDWGGICKHIVALLLTYVHNPQALRAIEPLDKMLEGKSKEDLIVILKDMLKHKPDLMSVVELASETQEIKQGKQMNVSIYRTQARRAMQNETRRSIERELKMLKETAARLEKDGDTLNSGAIYKVVLDETIKGYDEMMFEIDEDGDIAFIINDFAKGLGRCLAKSEADAKTRREWLETLLQAELADIKLGGIDLAPSAKEAILKYANKEEWLLMEERLSKIFSAKDDWTRDNVQKFLNKGRKKHNIKN